MKSVTNLGDFSDVKVGDVVIRLLAGTVAMKLNVVKIDDRLIYAVAPDGPQNDPWTFDRKSGVEEDDVLQWGLKYGATGSYLVSVEYAGNPDADGAVVGQPDNVLERIKRDVPQDGNSGQ